MSLLCILSVWLAKRDKEYDNRTTLASLYPLYSITKVASPINPRTTRTLLYWMSISAMSFAPAIYFSWIDTKNCWGNDLIWGTLCALIFSWIMNYLIGFIHFCFIRKRREHPAIKLVEIITLLTIIAFFACSLVAVIDMRREVDAGLWAACLGIAWALDNLIFDPIVAFLGRFKLFRSWI